MPLQSIVSNFLDTYMPNSSPQERIALETGIMHMADTIGGTKAKTPRQSEQNRLKEQVVVQATPAFSSG